VALALPFLVLYRSLAMLDTKLGLIVVYTLMVLPIVIWIMRDQFNAIPLELEQAAQVDGASIWVAFTRIVLPIALPGMIAAFILSVVLCWNEYFFAALLTSTDAKTLPVMVASQTGSQGIDWWSMAALSTAAIAPLVLIGVFLERYIVKGPDGGRNQVNSAPAMSATAHVMLGARHSSGASFHALLDREPVMPVPPAEQRLGEQDIAVEAALAGLHDGVGGLRRRIEGMALEARGRLGAVTGQHRVHFGLDRRPCIRLTHDLHDSAGLGDERVDRKHRQHGLEGAWHVDPGQAGSGGARAWQDSWRPPARCDRHGPIAASACSRSGLSTGSRPSSMFPLAL